MRIKDISKRNDIPNWSVDKTLAQFEAHLEKNGFNKVTQTLKDGKKINQWFNNKIKNFVTRNFSKTKGDTAEVIKQGKIRAKIRFKDEKSTAVED